MRWEHVQAGASKWEDHQLKKEKNICFISETQVYYLVENVFIREENWDGWRFNGILESLNTPQIISLIEWIIKNSINH